MALIRRKLGGHHTKHVKSLIQAMKVHDDMAITGSVMLRHFWPGTKKWEPNDVDLFIAVDFSMVAEKDAEKKCLKIFHERLCVCKNEKKRCARAIPKNMLHYTHGLDADVFLCCLTTTHMGCWDGRDSMSCLCSWTLFLACTPLPVTQSRHFRPENVRAYLMAQDLQAAQMS